MRRAEAAARRARARRVAARQRARERRERQARARRERRFKDNCVVLGGIPGVIEQSDGLYNVCVAPFGGLIYVPW
jgi:hypothetical protein